MRGRIVEVYLSDGHVLGCVCPDYWDGSPNLTITRITCSQPVELADDLAFDDMRVCLKQPALDKAEGGESS